MHVDIDWHVDMQKNSCASHFMTTCIFFWTCMFGKKCMLTLTGKNCMSNDAVVCGEKFYSMATSLPSSVGLVSNWGVLANLLTICIACLVSPHLMYHMFNLYRGLPFPSQVLDSETDLGFWHATLSRPEGGIHGFTGHLNKAAGPSIWWN